ncbi:type I-E CRISPR-associated protein Cas6/Cse3/CasE [Streptomyces sp. NPDC051576]|uniref:type I-E CRISPR-associated protein Cas6/Cse3/CasE n=1 Tax=Streptomyces sp. NPDC051576 TaxID=3155803 RepID=UPI003418BEF4
MHAAVLSGLATQPATERIRWRTETNTVHRAEILVLTDSRPSWEHLVEQAGWPGADGGQALIADYSPLLQRITLGREFTFRLTAKPVQRPQKPSDEQTARLKARTDTPAAPGTPAGHRGFRVAHRTADQQRGWLLKQADRHGFTVPSLPAPDPAPGLRIDEQMTPAPAVSLVAHDILRFTKRTGGARISISTVTFQGRLRVTDTHALRNALLTGIGPAKGYGQGLLTLAPFPAEATHG